MNCQYPNCPSGRAEEIQDQRHADTMAQLDKITSNQEQTMKILSSLNHLSESFKDFRDQDRKEHDEIFSRLRAVEVGKADTEDIRHLKRGAAKVVWDILKLSLAALVGIFGGKLIK